MNVLYVGPYRQLDEWGFTSRGFANLLASQDIDLTLRPVWFNSDQTLRDVGDLERFEHKKVEEPDVLIQHGLPMALNYNGKFKRNIAVTSVDCRVDNTDWVTHLNLFDTVVVFSKHEADILKDSGVTTPIYWFHFAPLYVVPEAQDLDLKFHGKKFYTIGSLDVKSGIRETIAAYLAEFSILDNVLLVVATGDAQTLEQEIKVIKQGLGKFVDERHYAHIAIINNTDQPVLNYLHSYCDVYVDVSYNSRTNQNLLKAIGNNSIPIMMDVCEPVIEGHQYLVESTADVSIYPQRPLPELYSGEFTWRLPNIKSIAENMRKLFEASEEEQDRAQQKIVKARSTLFTKPDKRIKELLNVFNK